MPLQQPTKASLTINPRVTARALFNSPALHPLTTYLREWKQGIHAVDEDYIIHVVGEYMALLTDTDTLANKQAGAEREEPPRS